MTDRPSSSWSKRTIGTIAGAFVLGITIMTLVGLLLVNIQERKAEAVQYPLSIVPIGQNELDPAVWGKNFPREYDSFMKAKEDSTRTPYGGSLPYDKLERYPVLKRLWNGYPFSVDFNEERGHLYAQTDQKNTKRTQTVSQPGACANCHAAEAPQLAASMGWEKFNSTPYNDIKNGLMFGTSCADCHDPATMDLRITRPALKNALAERGIDLSKATRQEMRTYVCAQCHVEYYFKGDLKLLTFPWSEGYSIENMESHYDKYAFRDWVHKDTGASMIKIQHPEFELWSSGIHARSGVACPDCHMPYIRDGAVKVSDHWIRSPLTNTSKACQTCHRQTEEELKQRINSIQNTTAGLLRQAETALTAAIDAIIAAKNAGASDSQLEEPRRLHRRGQMRWDFIFSENSTGFHSPQEAARVLAGAIDYARQAQIAAERLGRPKS